MHSILIFLPYRNKSKQLQQKSVNVYLWVVKTTLISEILKHNERRMSNMSSSVRVFGKRSAYGV